jgi:DNA-binding response OmpR family regulator
MKTPIILLTARNELDDRINGLNLGADDYLSKPFYIEELVARIEALVRRARGTGGELLRHGELVVDIVRRTVSQGERPPRSGSWQTMARASACHKPKAGTRLPSRPKPR